jgi:Tol biopolymer transport system component
VIPAAGGTPKRIAPELIAAEAPIWSPDGRRLLIAGINTDGMPDWWIAPLDGGEVITVGITPLARKARIMAVPAPWSGDRVILSSLRNDTANLWAVKLDTDSGKPTGEFQQITFGTAREQHPRLATDGSLVLASTQLSSDIWMLPADTSRAVITGELQRLTEDPAEDTEAAISTDGTKLAFLSTRGGNPALWVRDMGTAKLRKIADTTGRWLQISDDGRKVGFPVRGPSGVQYVISDLGDNSRREFNLITRITPWGMSPRATYVFEGGGSAGTLLATDVSSGERKEVIVQPKVPVLSVRLSPDERWLAFHARNAEPTRQIWIAPFRFGQVSRESEWIPVTDGKSMDRDPEWSPDGSIMYWIADRSGTRGIWACKLDPLTRRPVGSPFEVRMFRGTRRSMMLFENSGLARLGVARDKIVFALGDETGNIWMTRLDMTP